jgi:AraC-like DNA-binding protein
MSQSHNYLTINNPNTAGYHISATLPIGEWVEAPVDELTDIDETVANVQVKDLHLPNFWARKAEGVFMQDALFNNIDAIGLDCIGSCFFPKAEMNTTLNRQVVGQSFNRTHGFKFDPQNEFKHHIKGNTPFHIIHFAVSPNYILDFLPTNEAWAAQLRTSIHKGERIINSHYPNITLAQERILQNIMDCPLTGKFRVMMMETSIVQLMLLQFHSYYQNDTAKQSAAIKKDIDMVHGVKEYLSNNFLQDHSLNCLSKHFGTNTNKLMTLFKKTFGKSVFEFISELKMELAHRMLQDEGKQVVEVARVTGYKNPNHFSTAFKRRFGVSPSQVGL